MREILKANYELMQLSANQSEASVGLATYDVKNCVAYFEVVKKYAANNETVTIDDLTAGVYVLQVCDVMVWVTVTPHGNYIVSYDAPWEKYIYAGDNCYVIKHGDDAIIFVRGDCVSIKANYDTEIIVSTLPIFTANSEIKKFRSSENKCGGNIAYKPIR